MSDSMNTMMRLLPCAAVLSLIVGVDTGAQEAPQRTGGIPGVVRPDAIVELVQDGYSFTEGPVGTADGGLFFTDGKPTRIYRLHPGGRITVFRQDGGDADGLALNAGGILFSADRINKTGITRTDPDGMPTPLSTEAAPGRPDTAPERSPGRCAGRNLPHRPGPSISASRTRICLLPASRPDTSDRH